MKQRLVLAALLMQANTVVSVDRLIEVLWGNSPPDDASRTVTKYVYRLRLLFGSANAGILLTRPPGYLLSLQAEQLDSAQFAVLVSEAQRLLASAPDRALGLLDTALGLWHGPAWAEFADHDFIRPELTRLEGLRAIATEARADAMLTLERCDELIPDLETVVAEYPLRERPHAQLMLALYFSGRQADALALFRNFRRYLLDEVGLEPSESLRRLENDILQQKVQLAPRHRPTVVSTMWPPWADSVRHEQRLIGREELSGFEVLVARAVPATPSSGSSVAGIGKTCLVERSVDQRMPEAGGDRPMTRRWEPQGRCWRSSGRACTPPTRRAVTMLPLVVGDALTGSEAATPLPVLDEVDAAEQGAQRSSTYVSAI